jgi:hypothetical protein
LASSYFWAGLFGLASSPHSGIIAVNTRPENVAKGWCAELVGDSPPNLTRCIDDQFELSPLIVPTQLVPDGDGRKAALRG